MRLIKTLFLAVAVVFTAPVVAEDGLDQLAFIKGSWVTKTAYYADGQWGEPGKPGRATADTILGGSFIRLNTPIEFAGAPFQFEITLGYDRFNKVFRVTVLDDQNAYMDFFDGTLSGGVLATTNAASGTAFPTGQGTPRATAKFEIRKTKTGFELTGLLGQEGSEIYTPYMRTMFEPLH